MEVNTVLYGIVSVKEAIKAHRNCIIFSSNLPEHTTVMGRLLAETTQVYRRQTHKHT